MQQFPLHLSVNLKGTVTGLRTSSKIEEQLENDACEKSLQRPCNEARLQRWMKAAA